MSDPTIVRYGIYWVSLDPTRGHEMQKTRPCVVVSPAAMHRARMAVVCPLTTKLRPEWAHRIKIRFDGQINEIMVDQIRSVSLERFSGLVGRLEADDAQSLRDMISRLYVAA